MEKVTWRRRNVCEWKEEQMPERVREQLREE